MKQKRTSQIEIKWQGESFIESLDTLIYLQWRCERFAFSFVSDWQLKSFFSYSIMRRVYDMLWEGIYGESFVSDVVTCRVNHSGYEASLSFRQQVDSFWKSFYKASRTIALSITFKSIQSQRVFLEFHRFWDIFSSHCCFVCIKLWMREYEKLSMMNFRRCQEHKNDI